MKQDLKQISKQDARATRLGLALSGGGFRATLYHLGVVRFLRDAGILPSITHITSVSGGSIFAAHLVQNWDRYNGTDEQFEAIASEIVDFTRLDVRNRIVRRFPLALPIQLLRWAARIGANEKLTRTGLLQVQYQNCLYGDSCLFQLPAQPYLHILSTNLTEGALCSFNRDGIIVQKRLPGELFRFDQLHAGLATLALAVTASSAFPGFFPPLEVHWREVGGVEGQFNRQVFTDGGVFDNLGVRMFRNLERSWIGREAELSRRDFYDVECVVRALSVGNESQQAGPVVRLAQLYNEQNGNDTREDSVVEGLRQVVMRSRLYREPAFDTVQPEDPEALTLLRSARGSGKELDFHDRSWLNRQLLEAVLRNVTGKRCLRPLNAMFDAVLVSDAGKHLRAITEVRPMGMITTAMRASDIGMDRVWQLEKETFSHQPGFIFIPISHVVDPQEDATALHPEVQRCLPNIRTDMDAFTSLEIRSLVRHGYCVARAICRSRPELRLADVPANPPWDPEGRTESAKPLRGFAATSRFRAKPGPIPEVAAARALQASELRQVWNRLVSWRDWTSYVYLAVLIGLLMIGPTVAYRFYDQRQQVKQSRKLVEAIAHTDRDQMEILRLEEQGPIQPWPAATAETIATIGGPVLHGIVYTTDREIVDLRPSELPIAGGGQAATYSAYISRRIRFHKTRDYEPAGRFALPITVFAVNCEVRCLNVDLEPRLRRLDQVIKSTSGAATEWELTLDLSSVPIGEPIDVLIDILSRDPLPADFWQRPHLDLMTRLPVEEMVLWLLVPKQQPFERYRILETREPGKSHLLIPSEGVQDTKGTILHWSLFEPEPRAIYTCQWQSQTE
ncbi:MAG TPA: patatin-like phospholipase family protein [Pirellulales bacterium]|jgi:predicted acylesterase/phospholipase RssA|nr:patatin-like phospholipase family protein [Pirellulales bacterium]